MIMSFSAIFHFIIPNAKLRKNVSIIITLVVSFMIPLLPIITIITYYYVFESEKLADEEISNS